MLTPDSSVTREMAGKHRRRGLAHGAQGGISGEKLKDLSFTLDRKNINDNNMSNDKSWLTTDWSHCYLAVFLGLDISPRSIIFRSLGPRRKEDCSSRIRHRNHLTAKVWERGSYRNYTNCCPQTFYFVVNWDSKPNNWWGCGETKNCFRPPRGCSTECSNKNNQQQAKQKTNVSEGPIGKINISYSP